MWSIDLTVQVQYGGIHNTECEIGSGLTGAASGSFLHSVTHLTMTDERTLGVLTLIHISQMLVLSSHSFTSANIKQRPHTNRLNQNQMVI